jgi:hypothetical protein
MKAAVVLALIPLFGAPVMAQESSPRPAKERSWSGILVDSRCKVDDAAAARPREKSDPGSLMDKSTPVDSGRTWNGTDPNTSGTVDRSGTTPANDRWDRSCFVTPATPSYALKLQDGRTVKFDDAGNSRIHSELKSNGRVRKAHKVLRVRVTGTMEGDTVHVSNVHM